MTDKFEWKEVGNTFYYYSKTTGKIVGKASKLSMQEIWISLVYTGEYTFTIDDERHLGQYIDFMSASRAIEYFWDVQNRTLIADS